MRAKALLAGLIVACASAQAPATDRTDLWFNPNESGWGMNIAQQDDILFLTFFVYGNDGQPTWYVGPATQFTGNVGGVNQFSGPLYRVTGPWFGAPFNPSSVATTQVGTVTYSALSVTTGRVTYTVSGTTVTKEVQRQTFRNNPNVYGTFVAAYVGEATGCSNPAFNGRLEMTGVLTISGNASQTTATFTSPLVGTCTISGPYTQAGRMGRIGASAAGAFSCPSAGISGTSAIFEIEAATNVISGRFQHNYSGCIEVGHFAGARR